MGLIRALCALCADPLDAHDPMPSAVRLLRVVCLVRAVVGLEFDRKDIEMNKVVVSTLEARFNVLDMRTQHPTEGFARLTEKAHKATVWMTRHLPQVRCGIRYGVMASGMGSWHPVWGHGKARTCWTGVHA